MVFGLIKTFPGVFQKITPRKIIRYHLKKIYQSGLLIFIILNIVPGQTNTLGLSTYLSSDEQNYLFEHLTIGNNKSTPIVHEIYQDKKGFMWIGTNSGLYRYDGSDWLAFKNTHDDSTSISDDQVRDLFEDSRGRMWIGTVRGGLCQFLPDQHKFIRYPFYQEGISRNLKSTELSHSEVYDIIEDLKGGLWVGTYNGGLNHMIIPDDPNQAPEFIHYTNNENDPNDKNPNIVYTLFRDSKGQAWMGTRYHGLAKLIEDPETGELIEIQYMTDLYPDPSYKNNPSCSVIYEDSFGDLWYGSFNPAGVLCRIQNPHGVSSDPVITVYRHSEKDEQTIHKGAIYAINEDSEGKLWISTTYGGISFFNRKSGRFTRLYSNPDKYRGLTPAGVFSLFLDQQKNMWIGTGEGIDILFQQTLKIKCYQHDQNNSNSIVAGDIAALFKDKSGKIWINSQSNGLCIYNPENDQFTYNIPDDLKSGLLTSQNSLPLYEDNKNFIWFANNDYLFRYDGRAVKSYNLMQENSYKPLPVSVRTILTDHKGILWVAGEGLWTYDYKTDTFTEHFTARVGPKSLSNKWITDLAEDNKGRLWVGTFMGLCRINESRDSVTHFISNKDQPGSLSGNIVSYLFIDSRNILWIGTASNGLNRYDENTGTFKNYDESDGLPSNQIGRILEDNYHNLWIGTENGLGRFNTSSETATVFTDKDGFLDRSLNWGSCLDNNGRMYFGSTHGLNAFYPDDFQSDEPHPTVVLTGFLLDNQPVPIKKNGLLPYDITYCDQITLDYQKNDFAFDFTALKFFKQSQSRFAYKLDGFENDWTYTTFRNRRANYTNIPPGEYIFRVMADNGNGEWSEENTSLKVTILPPWWQTWWAESLAVFLLLSSVASFYFWRINRLKKRQAELECEVAKRTADLKDANDKLVEMDKFKEGMTSMIVHDLKNPLNTILHAPDSVSDIKNAGNQMLNMVMNILDVRKFEEAKMILDCHPASLLHVSMSSIQQVVFLSRRKNITIENRVLPVLKVMIDAPLIERTFVNLLTNAIKFSPNNERILIETGKSQNGFIQISVSDNGPGIPEEKIGTIFDKFAQVEVKESGKIRSSGLGLTFCKLAIEAHSGKISVQSKEDNGTTFIFTLPLAESYEIPDVTGTTMEVDFDQFHNDIVLTGKDKEEIKTVLKKLKQLEVYQLTKLTEVLEEINTKNNCSLNQWQNELKTAIYSNNEKMFNYLIKIAE